jgi:hypothetical protein
MDVDGNIPLRVLALQEEQLRDDEICYLIIDRCAQKNDTFLQKERKNIECALGTWSTFDNGRDDCLY